MQILWASVHILTHALKNFCRQNAINSMPWLGRNIQKQSFTGVLMKCPLKICHKFTGEHPCRSKATLLKSHFGMGALLYICYIFSEHLFLRTPQGGYFWLMIKIWLSKSIAEHSVKLFSEISIFHMMLCAIW